MRLLGWIFLSGGLSATVAYVIGREHGIREGSRDVLSRFYQDRHPAEDAPGLMAFVKHDLPQRRRDA